MHNSLPRTLLRAELRCPNHHHLGFAEIRQETSTFLPEKDIYDIYKSINMSILLPDMPFIDIWYNWYHWYVWLHVSDPCFRRAIRWRLCVRGTILKSDLAAFSEGTVKHEMTIFFGWIMCQLEDVNWMIWMFLWLFSQFVFLRCWDVCQFPRLLNNTRLQWHKGQNSRCFTILVEFYQLQDFLG